MVGGGWWVGRERVGSAGVKALDGPSHLGPFPNSNKCSYIHYYLLVYVCDVFRSA